MTDPAESLEPAVDLEPAERLEMLREAVTMALYIGLSLLAVLTALPTQSAEENSSLAWLVTMTAVGLVLAHQVAFRMSTRLVSHGRLEPLASRLLLAQLAGGALVTLIAVVPLVILGPQGLPWSRFLLLAFVGVVGYLVARSVPISRVRALLYVAGVIVVVMIVLGVKGLVGH